MHALKSNYYRGAFGAFAAFAVAANCSASGDAMARPRGLMAAYNGPDDAGAVLNELTQAFATFRSTNDTKVNKLANSLDEVNTVLAAIQVGGAGGDDFLPAASHRRAVQNLGKFARTGRPEDLMEGFSPQNRLTSQDDPSGGYAVPDELGKEIIRIQRNSSAMRRLARVVSTNSAEFKQILSAAGLSSGWVGEEETRPETDGPDFKQVIVSAGEIYANPAITRNLLDDSAFDMGSFLATEIGDEFTAMEGAAFITGNGFKKPMGLLAYAATSEADSVRAFGKLQYIPTGESGAFATATTSVSPADALIELVYAVKAKYRANSAWLMNSKTASVVRKWKDPEGRFIWSDSLIIGQPPTLLGSRVEIDEDMQDVGANTFPIAFGDFQRGYLITDRQGIRVIRDELTHKPFVHFYTTKRVGGSLLDSNAIKLIKCSAT